MCLIFKLIFFLFTGLASAIFLSKKGYKISIFEKNSTLEQAWEDSYPIGVNPRGMSVLEQIEKLLENNNNNNDQNEGMGLEEMKKEVIEGWEIYVKGWKVASLPSGTTCGATRGAVVKKLYDVARKEGNISFFFSHKLVEVDFGKKLLFFAKQGEGGEIAVVEGGRGRVIAGDGVWSKMRREVERHIKETEKRVDEEHHFHKATIHPLGGTLPRFVLFPQPLHLPLSRPPPHFYGLLCCSC